MNVALRAVHERLARNGDPVPSWRMFVDLLQTEVGPEGVVRTEAIEKCLGAAGVAAPAREWSTSLRTFGVLDGSGRIVRSRADDVTTALGLVGDSFAVSGIPSTWAAVATLPSEVRSVLRPPALRQTAGVMLGLIDRSSHKVTLAAPFVDGSAVRFLRGSIAAALRRDVVVHVLTSTGRGVELQPFVEDALLTASSRLSVTELETDISSLGSHAKVLLVDDREAYVGSANLTAAGLGRHVEIGVELAGRQVEALTRLVAALERLGRRVVEVVDGRRRV